MPDTPLDRATAAIREERLRLVSQAGTGKPVSPLDRDRLFAEAALRATGYPLVGSIDSATGEVRDRREGET